MGLLPRRPQERFRTRPSHTSLVRVEQEGVGIDKPDQIGRVEVPLHLQATGGTVMHPLRQRFLRDATTLTGLRQFGRAGGNEVHLPASTCSQTGQDLHETPRRTTLDGTTVPALPRSVGHLLEQEHVALPYDLVG